RGGGLPALRRPLDQSERLLRGAEVEPGKGGARREPDRALEEIGGVLGAFTVELDEPEIDERIRHSRIEGDRGLELARRLVQSAFQPQHMTEVGPRAGSARIDPNGLLVGGEGSFAITEREPGVA